MNGSCISLQMLCEIWLPAMGTLRIQKLFFSTKTRLVERAPMSMISAHSSVCGSL